MAADKKRFDPGKYNGSTSRGGARKGPEIVTAFGVVGGAYTPTAKGAGRSGAPTPNTIRRGDHPRADPRLPQVPRTPRSATFSLKDIDKNRAGVYDSFVTLLPSTPGGYYSPIRRNLEQALWKGRRAISPGVAALSALNSTKGPSRWEQEKAKQQSSAKRKK